MADAPRRFNQSLTDLNSDDFLFQLYHGAELLHDDRVHEAKEAIEGALRLQPRDPKGQNLLGLVYFRLGVYPHAIGIFEELVRDYPSEPAPRINLALCFLKTGQPERARRELEEVTRLDPSRDRAWGYLGLAYDRLGNPDKAQVAWARAGRFCLSKRGQQLSTNPPLSSDSVELGENQRKVVESEGMDEVRRVAEQAFVELDGPSFSFSLAQPASGGGAWSTVESGKGGALREERSPVSRIPGREDAVSPPSSGRVATNSEEPVPESAPPRNSVGAFVRIHSIGAEEPARLLADGSLVFKPGADSWIREELLIAASDIAGSDQEMAALPPHFVNLGVGMFRVISGSSALLRPSSDRILLPVLLGTDDVFYVSEVLLAGASCSARVDAGHIPVGEAQAISMLKVSGAGYVILQLPRGFGTIPLARGASVKVSRDAILGWFGVLRPRPYSDAPSAFFRNWIMIEGEGSLLVQTSSPSELGRYY